MSRNRLIITVVMALLAALMVGSLGSAAAQSNDIAWETIEIEVAEDGNRFKFDDLNLHEDGMPAYGSAFVTQGYIYPVGTLSGTNGVLDDGSPEFPELVLGEWVVSTQVYAFNDGSTIITNGTELADIGIAGTRAVTGGTGSYRSASGEQMQTLLGFTDTMGVNLTVSFTLAAMPVPAMASNDTAAIYPWDTTS